MALMVLPWGCSRHSDRSSYPQNSVVTIYYAAGYNNLSSDITSNIKTITKGPIPFPESRHVFLSFAHLSVSDVDFKTPCNSYLIRYTKSFGKLTADTLLKVDASRTASDSEVLREVLLKAAELYPDAKYGLVLSSHGSGWLPAVKYNPSYKPIQYSSGRRRDLPIYDRNSNPDEPKVKTFGAEVLLEGGNKYSQEMTIQSMAKAIPVHLEYIVFDACLMGGVEVAYELKDVADKIAFSPTEILQYGFDYDAMPRLFSDSPDVEGFCEDYFRMYDARSGRDRSATITVIRSDKLSALATVSAGLFAKYRSAMDALGLNSGVQEYFRDDEKHWHYDFRDIIAKAGADETDLAALDAALDACITYKAATTSFLGLQIKTYSGLSMYMPAATKNDAGVAELNAFYKTFAWNKDTNLVE